MSENQIFCYAEKFGADYPDSYRQKHYRVFNVEITKEKYNNIKIPYLKLEFDEKEEYSTRYKTAFKKAWSKASEELRQQFFDIPHFDWDIFTKITGVEENNMSKKTLTYQEVYDQIKKAGEPIKFGVDSNARNEGGYNEIYFITIGGISGCVSSWEADTGHDPDTETVDYEWISAWCDTYKGKFYDLSDLSEETKIGDIITLNGVKYKRI